MAPWTRPYRRRSLDGAVVAVTGATSGLGRATAHAFAAHGATVVVLARDGAAVEQVARECRERGGEALAAPADTADAVAVEAAADDAVRRFGRLDVWVNAASVGIVGEFGKEPLDEVRREVDTNVFGYVVGSRVALAQFERQGGGTLVNVSSLLGVVPNPLVPTYVMTKFAIRGLTSALRHAARRRPGVAVCSVLPGPIDTPFFERAANHTGRRARAVPPAMAPERVAAKVVRCARRPRREVTVGFVPHVVLYGHRFAPRTVEWLVAEYSARLILRREPAPEGAGALFGGPSQAATHGGWRRGRVRRHLGERLGRARARAA
jgi:short-subunit dehydrogenase